jgi:excisionase family DNA binding protein
MNRSQLPELLSLAEASEILKAHPNSLRKWDRDGILKAVRFGKRGDRRYRREDLEKFINNKIQISSK